MNPLSEQFKLESTLKDHIKVYRRLWGDDKFEEEYQKLAPDIQYNMARQGESNPIKYVIPAAKAMSKDGKDPSWLITVAAEMSLRNGDISLYQMFIFIDPLQHCTPNSKWKWEQVSHLFCSPSDVNEKKLHEFALSLGLKPEWYQISNPMNHYDLTPAMREKARQAGAIQLNLSQTVEYIRLWRAYKNEKQRKDR